jgi:hypothetical protein
MEEATLEERRRRYRTTTMGQRLESSFELSEFARELKAGMPRSK